ncbi:MAG: NEW3 domain-containing protein [Candidatus Bathyarchaeota archaeon]|nr:NEW3 domain-containing protein [Candidatus Bathyarchaeota archaeon]
MIHKKPSSKTMALVTLFLFCTTLFLSPLTIVGSAYGQTQTTHVFGSVVTEDGVGIGDVTVEILTNGRFVAGIKTNSEGVFVTPEIEFGSYTFQFSKVGYKEASTTVVIDTFDQIIQSVALHPGLSISASVLQIIAEQGETVTIPFTVRYEGAEGVESVEFAVSTSHEMLTRILQGTYEVNQIEMASGQSVTLQLETTIPSAVTENTRYNISLTAIGKTNASKTFTVAVYTEGAETEVSGTVVDSQGVGMADVSVEAYSGDVLVADATTYGDGSFNLGLTSSNSYSLKFSKPGYVEYTKMVSVSAADSQIVLSEVVLSKVLWLTSSILGTAANPGDTLVLPFMASNVGSEIEPVGFSAVVPAGWAAKVMDNGGHRILETSLSPSSNANLQLEVEIPLDANGSYEVTLTASGEVGTTLTFTVQVEPADDSMLNCAYPGKSSNAGDFVRFEMALTNPFSVDMRFKLSVDQVPENWTAFMKSTDGDYLTEVLLEADQTVNLVLEVKSPSSALTNQTYELSANAEAVNQGITDTISVTVTVTELANEITLTAKLPEVAVEAGNSVSYPLTVSNMGTTDRYLLLSVEPPANWKAVFRLGDVEVTRLYLYGGNSSDLTVIVTPPSSVALDTYTFPVKIKSESGVVLTEANLTTTVVGSYRLDMSLSTYMATANSGESATFTATITNSGYTTLTDLSMNITLPADGWSVNISPVNVEMLKSRESATFNVEVTTPENTVAGDYMVSVKGESNQMGSGVTQVRLTVAASTSWGLYGIAIAAVFIILLIAVFWKFKRR